MPVHLPLSSTCPNQLGAPSLGGFFILRMSICSSMVLKGFLFSMSFSKKEATAQLAPGSRLLVLGSRRIPKHVSLP